MIDQIVKALTDVLMKIIGAIPSVILALVIILIGYLIGLLAKAAVRFIFDRALWRFLKRTVIGRKFEEAGVNLGDILGSTVLAIIIALAILLAINMLGILGPAVEMITYFVNLLIGILGGVIVLLVGIPLASLAGEYIAKLLGLAFGEKDGITSVVQAVLTILFILFVIGMAIGVMFGIPELLKELSGALPKAFTAGIIIIVGYIIGDIIGRTLKSVLERISKPLESTDIGSALRATGLDTASLISNLVKAMIVVIAITVGLGMITLTGVAADVLSVVTYYLPRVFGALVVILLGLPLILILSKYIGKIFKAVLEEKYEALADLIENLIAIGLVAVFLTIALNILALPGEYVYTFIIGVLIIALGVVVIDNVTGILKETSPVFGKLLPIIGTVFIFVILYVGLVTILSQISGAIEVLKVLSWGVAAAMAIALLIIMFYFIRVALKEAKEQD